MFFLLCFGLSLYLLYKYASYTFKRRIPLTLNDGIFSPLKLPDDGSVYQSTKLTEVERDYVRSVYLKKPEFHWMAGLKRSEPVSSILSNSTVDPTQSNVDQNDLIEKHKIISNYLADLIVSFTELYGVVLFERDVSDKNGSLVGCVCLIPPYPSYEMRSLHWMKVMMSLGFVPVPMNLGSKSIADRFNAFVETTEDVQRKTMKHKSANHWYMIVNAALPSSTKTLQAVEEANSIDRNNEHVPFAPTLKIPCEVGISTKLFDVVKQIVMQYKASDMKNSDCNYIYSECSDELVSMHESIGFINKNRYKLVSSGLAEDDAYFYNAMVWQVQCELQ